MKKFQKLLGLFLIGSLLAVHPISGADFSMIVNCNLGEGLGELFNLFVSQSVDGERGNPELSNENIEDYLDRMHWRTRWHPSRFEGDSLKGNSHKVSFAYNSLSMEGPRISLGKQREYFNSRLKEDENLKSRMKECAKKVLAKRGFDFDWMICEKNKLMQLKDYNEWIVPIISLTLVTDGSSCNDFSYVVYDNEKKEVQLKCTEEMCRRFKDLFPQDGANIKRAKRD